MMGSGGRGVSICPATLGHRCLPAPDSQRDRLAHRPHGNDAAPPWSGGNWNSSRHAAARRRRPACPSGTRCRRPTCGAGCTASLRATATRARAMPRRLAMLMPHARNADHLAAADQQRMGRLVERRAGQLVAAPADAALHVGLAGLVAARRQAEMRADVARLSEAVRLVDRGAERQRGQRADARHRHQPAADRLDPHRVEHALGEPVDLRRSSPR